MLILFANVDILFQVSYQEKKVQKEVRNPVDR